MKDVTEETNVCLKVCKSPSPGVYTARLLFKERKVSVRIWTNEQNTKELLTSTALLPQVAQKPVLVLLHGFMQTSASWDFIARRLAQKYFVVAPDLPGHGGTVLPAREEFFSFEAHIELLQTLFHALSRDVFDSRMTKPLLVGYSMGGRIAAGYACKNPRSLLGLVLESAGLGLATPTDKALRAAKNEDLCKQLRTSSLEEFVDRWERQPLFASQKLLPQAVQEHQRTLRLQQKPKKLAASLRYAGVQCMPNLRPELITLDLPWLYLAGELDVTYTEIAQSLPTSPLHQTDIIVQAGHNIHLEQPKEYCRRLETFFNECL